MDAAERAERDAQWDRDIHRAARQLHQTLSNVALSLDNARLPLAELHKLFAIEWAEGPGAGDIAHHLDDAARAVRAAIALHRQYAVASGLALAPWPSETHERDCDGEHVTGTSDEGEFETVEPCGGQCRG